MLTALMVREAAVPLISVGMDAPVEGPRRAARRRAAREGHVGGAGKL